MAKKKQAPFGPQDGDKTNIAVQRDTVNTKAGDQAQEKPILHGLF